MKSNDIKELHKWLNNLLKEKYINKADIKQILNDFDWDNISNLVEARVSPKVAIMTIDELYAEYEQNLNMTMDERDKIIFRYAYFIGKNNLDKKE